MKPQNVHEGDWFAVPLREGGYGLGVVARKGKHGILLGYFFGPRRESLPSLAETEKLTPRETVLVERFGDLGLRDRTWTLLGASGSWTREAWPIPEFRRTEVPSGKTWKVIYIDDPRIPGREEPCSPEVAATLLPDRLAGAGAVEIRLTELLRPRKNDA